MHRLLAPWIVGGWLAVLSSASQADLDPELPDYEKASGIAGNISSAGSDTLANLMTLWAEDFKRVYPNVNIQIQAAGSSTAPPGLTEGTSNLGPMSRNMKDNEIEAFEDRYGYRPTAVPVAIDALTVFVHRDNPIEGMTLAEVDAAFSATRKCGLERTVERWSDLGIKGRLGMQTMQLYGRNSVSGTYGYFKEEALCKGDFRNTVNEQPGSASVVQGVSESLNGLGYSGIGYRTASVRAVPLARKAGDPYVDATAANAVSGQYPLSRYLYVYVNKPPNKPLDPIIEEFLSLVLSRQGQEVVLKDGYVPLPESVAKRARAELGI